MLKKEPEKPKQKKTPSKYVTALYFWNPEFLCFFLVEDFMKKKD